MIHVTRLNNEELIVNADLIEFIEKTPDTVLTLITGKKMMVRESSDEIVQRVLDYRRLAGMLHLGPAVCALEEVADQEKAA
jgi:flagellar protein FlbD